MITTAKNMRITNHDTETDQLQKDSIPVEIELTKDQLSRLELLMKKHRLETIEEALIFVAKSIGV